MLGSFYIRFGNRIEPLILFTITTDFVVRIVQRFVCIILYPLRLIFNGCCPYGTWFDVIRKVSIRSPLKRRFNNVVSLILYSRVDQVRWAKIPTARVTSS